MAKGLDSQFAKARSAEARGDFPAAAAIYCEIASHFPGNLRVNRAWGTMKQRIGELLTPQAEQVYAEAMALYEAGRLSEVVERLEHLMVVQSGQPAFQNLLGAALIGMARPKEAEAAFRKAIALDPAVADGYNNLGNALKDQQRTEEACEAYCSAIQRRQDYPEAWNNLGAVLQQLGRLTEALAAFDTSVTLKPAPDTINNRAAVLLAQERFAEAEASFREAASLAPERPQFLCNLGDCLLHQDRVSEAVSHLRRAVELQPDYGEGWNNLGVALRRSGDVSGALAAYEKALALSPNLGSLRTNRATLLQDDGKEDEAALEYLAQLEQAPEDTVSLNNLGAILQGQGQFTHALMLYDRALAIDPDYLDAKVNRGNALRDLGWVKEAEEAMSTALSDNPKVAALWLNLAVARQDLGDVTGALAAYGKALELDPTHSEARMQMLYQRAQTCDWTALDALEGELALIDGGAESAAAFPALGMCDDPAFQYRRSASMAGRWAKLLPEPLAPAEAEPADRRIRIGYFSGDYHDHAIMFLASGLFREHDKSRFEVFAYSSGLVRQGVMRDRLIGDVEHFHDTVEMAERDAFDLARSHRLDIAIDVSGYTKGSRTGLFARRIAPVQINYLGYPGTMAAPFMDYIVVDPVLVPPDERAHVSEKLIVLPGSYQPNDNAREIAAVPTTRADFGLPADGFVFCCFNQPFKITPREFDIWMRLLDAVPGSVLWMRDANDAMRINLCREAEVRGIDAGRLVFADRAPHAEHLERHRHADLFLDTFAYNAHTTMSDALWAGLPAITRLGRQFAARVGASLLVSVGLDEMIAATDADYEALALALARDPVRLAAIRAKLAANLPSAPLFDTQGYTRALEAGYLAALDRHRRGLPPEDFSVAPPA